EGYRLAGVTTAVDAPPLRCVQPGERTRSKTQIRGAPHFARKRNSLCERATRRRPLTFVDLDLGYPYQRVGKQTKFPVRARTADQLYEDVLGMIELADEAKASAQIAAHLRIVLKLVV